MATVSLRNVGKRYGKNQAVRGLSLDVHDGEFFFLLGPSGAGKTSTLKMIAGLEEVTEGEVFIGDELVNNLAPRHRDVAMAFESYALYPHMTVFENLAFPLKAPARKTKLTASEIKERVQKVAEMLQIAPLLERMPGQLSGGQRQRTSLGRALVREPRAFLMDEPIVHLDAKLRNQMRAELKKIQRDFGFTTIYATPDFAEALAMADRVAVLNRGEVQQLGTPQNLFEHPANLFVADFVGEPSMNFLDCSLQSEGDQLYLTSRAVKVPLLAQHRATLVGNAADGNLVLGLRPSAVRLGLSESATTPIPSEVYVCEPLGRSTLVEAQIGDKVMAVRVPGELCLEIGQPVWLGFDLAGLHVFDKATGRALV
ncbi:MAG: ABC transporter ATP-binding protein [Chloroflexota bacterium]